MLADVTLAHGQQYNALRRGEVNVVTKMKETNTVIGGEGKRESLSGKAITGVMLWWVSVCSFSFRGRRKEYDRF